MTLDPQALTAAVAREVSRAMLDNPSDAEFAVRVAKREQTAADYARAIVAMFAPEPSGWQDISTAPKDGTAILGYWLTGLEPEKPWTVYGVTRWSTGWVDVDDVDNFYADPTHWQPLPPPPVGTRRDLADANSKSPIQAREE